MTLGQDSPASERMSRPLSRRELRKQIGPSNPLYGFLMQLAIQDLAVLDNDDFVILDAARWTAEDSDQSTPFAVSGGGASGFIRGTTTAQADDWIRLTSIHTSYDSAHRPMAIFRFKSDVFNSGDDTLKFEMGFKVNSDGGAADNANEDTAGGAQVLLKSTPTSSANDYSVVILDTDDNILWDVIGDDDGVPVTSNVSSSIPWDATPGSTGEKKVDAQTTIAFVDNGSSADTITDSGNDLAQFAVGDFVQVSGSVSNNRSFEVTAVAAGTLTLTSGVVVTETAGATVTLTATDLTDGDDDYNTVVVAQNEEGEAYGWVNGHFIARVGTADIHAAPDTGVGEFLHFYFQNRAAAAVNIDIDFIKGWQERLVIS